MRTFTCVACEACGQYHPITGHSFLLVTGHPDEDGGLVLETGWNPTQPNTLPTEKTLGKTLCRKPECLTPIVESMIGYDPDYARIGQRELAHAQAMADKPTFLTPSGLAEPGARTQELPPEVRMDAGQSPPSRGETR